MRCIKLVVVMLFCTALYGCFKSDIHSCLDRGGSFNYDTCECDLQTNHEFKENHTCGS